jgi:protein-tyrosine phosphatase
MVTEVLSVTSEDTYRESVRKAAKTLREGGLVAFPTETVYGVAASAEIAEAVDRLRAVKGRSKEGSLTVHIAQRLEAEQFVEELTAQQRRMIRRSWPGPLTLIIAVPHPERTRIAQGRDSAFVERVYYDGSIGLRCPDCDAARDLIAGAGSVVVASSANRAGNAPPTDAGQALAELQGEIDLLLDGGETRYAAPSTIARLSEYGTEILRCGVLDERTVRRLATTNILLVCTGNTCRSPMAEGLLKNLLAEKLGCAVDRLEEHGLTVSSAGTAAFENAPPTPEAIEALAEQGIDISDQRSSTLTAEAVEEAQVILVMTESHRARVLELTRGEADCCHLVGGDVNIADPLGTTTAVYMQCRDQIKAGLETHLTETIL